MWINKLCWKTKLPSPSIIRPRSKREPEHGGHKKCFPMKIPFHDFSFVLSVKKGSGASVSLSRGSISFGTSIKRRLVVLFFPSLLDGTSQYFPSLPRHSWATSHIGIRQNVKNDVIKKLSCRLFYCIIPQWKWLNISSDLINSSPQVSAITSFYGEVFPYRMFGWRSGAWWRWTTMANFSLQDQNKAVLNPRGAWKCCFLAVFSANWQPWWKFLSEARRIYLSLWCKILLLFFFASDEWMKKFPFVQTKFPIETACDSSTNFPQFKWQNRERWGKLICGLVYFLLLYFGDSSAGS